jgi:selenocysteine lyase/cysteine desulfurase
MHPALVSWVRDQFPQIESDGAQRPRVYLDNAAGTLMPQSVADAMREAALWLNAQPERSWPAARATAARHRQMRAALRDFLGAAPEDVVVVNDSTTASLHKLRLALEEHLTGGNVIVTDGDHYANISAWEWRAAWQVRRARMRPEDGGLDLDHLASLLDDQTRVVALAAATNGLGTRYDVPAVARLVRGRSPGALLVVDAVHLALHAPIDIAAWECDALAFSTYKLFGPYAGVLWVRAGLAPRLAPYHVEPHTDPASTLETGTRNNVTVAGISAALAYLQELGARVGDQNGQDSPPASLRSLEAQRHGEKPEETSLAFLRISSEAGASSEAGGGSFPVSGRRQFLRTAMTAIEAYEAELSRALLDGLRSRPGLGRVRLFGVAEPERVVARVPTFAFAVDGIADAEVERRLWEEAGLQVAAGNHYAASVTRGLGREGVVRASFAHYNTLGDVERLLDALERL